MERLSHKYGINTLQFPDFGDFMTFIISRVGYAHFIWRGQSDSSWKLEPTLDRTLAKTSNENDINAINNHLLHFKHAIRGRRGKNPTEIKTENDWWALGQHYGLATPLLDWTKSPFVAAFFAYASAEASSTNERAVFGISQNAFEHQSHNIIEKYVKTKLECDEWDLESPQRPPIVEFISPLSDDNPRLVNQAGLFTRTPTSIDLESWVQTNFKEDEKRTIITKLIFPDSDREMALKCLNRMNINYLTLFPDLYGASKFVNLSLDINRY